MAEVHLARMVGPSGFERIVVIKRMLTHLSENPSHVAMFRDEAELLARIQHRNVVQVYGLHQTDTRYEIIMEYLDGETAASYFEKTAKADPWLSAYIISEAARGLHAAHELRRADGTSYNVVHRDVSPQNIFITYDGEIKVLDFGVARAEDRHTRTESGVIKGKLSYMAPEQIADQRAVDRRSDIFALGTLLYELSTGKPLFERGGVFEVVSAVCTEPAPLPTLSDPDYPPELEAICLRALQKAPADRYQTADEMARELQAASGRHAHPAILKERLARLMSEVFFERRTHKRLMMESSKPLEVNVERSMDVSRSLRASTPVPLPETLGGAILRAMEQDGARVSASATFNDDDTIVVPEGEAYRPFESELDFQTRAERVESGPSVVPRFDLSGGITGPLPRARTGVAQRARAWLVVGATLALIALGAGALALWVVTSTRPAGSVPIIAGGDWSRDPNGLVPRADRPPVDAEPQSHVLAATPDAGQTDPSRATAESPRAVTTLQAQDAGASSNDAAIGRGDRPDPPTVTIRVHTRPEGATIRLDDGATCTSPCSLRLPQSETSTHLRARRGRRSASLDFVPDQDRRIELQLRRLRTRRTREPADIPEVFTDFDD